jgi:hypothetical protein
VSDDDEAVMKRLAVLEAEVKTKADADRARKEAALAKVREQRAKQAAERDALRSRQTELVTKKPAPVAKTAVVEDDDEDDDGGLGSTLALAKRAHGVKQELSKKPKAGEKSWVTSGVASLLLGPLGWLYAGSFRESVPASAAWLAFGALASKIIPFFLLMPVLMVAMPLSGIAGVLYAVHYNRKGGRQRLFGNKDQKKLPPGK